MKINQEGNRIRGAEIDQDAAPQGVREQPRGDEAPESGEGLRQIDAVQTPGKGDGATGHRRFAMVL